MLKRLLFNKFLRFAAVGLLNTTLDIVLLNLFLWILPAENIWQIVSYNTLAYTLGAVNSFFWNKYWSFRHEHPVTFAQVGKFALVTSGGILMNNTVLWMFLSLLPVSVTGAGINAVLLKVAVAATTMLLSFFAMVGIVFVGKKNTSTGETLPEYRPAIQFPLSLSVVLPAYNEEAVIGSTLTRVLTVLSSMVQDFEVIVVNDGSRDKTGLIIADIARYDRRVRLIEHSVNMGYGAALANGLSRAEKKYTFFMDSDGQFDIADLARLLPYVSEYDGVFGYRINRQDTALRKLNAWGWKQLIKLVFGVRVRDIDCAFKVFRSDFFWQHPLETRGAMINAEMLYKFYRAGNIAVEVGVQHYPRRAGKATGAKISVIARALSEVGHFAQKWAAEERAKFIPDGAEMVKAGRTGMDVSEQNTMVGIRAVHKSQKDLDFEGIA